MAHTKSAKKRHRQSETRRLTNRSTKSMLKTLNKKVRDAATAGNVESAEAQARVVAKKLDQAAARGVIHPNAAARTKSRLQSAIKSAKGK